jgi:TrmH family RNA methyltransferase
VTGLPLAFTNTKVQRLRRLLGRRSARSEESAFVVEGATLIGEAMAAGWTVDAEFVAPGAGAVSQGEVFELAEGVLERIASTEHPQPNVAIVRIPEHRASLEHADFVLVADALNDPGNLGTILRSAEAAGVDVVVLTPGSVDPFNPKVVRASAGALFHVPVVGAALEVVRDAGFRMIGTSSHTGERHTAIDWSGRVAIVLGSEAQGLPDDVAVDAWVRIEHHGRAESLNVAMAATLLVFAAAEQRAGD